MEKSLRSILLITGGRNTSSFYINPSPLQLTKGHHYCSLRDDILLQWIKEGAVIVLDIQQIQEIIPHRYPFLLVDRILEIEPGVRAKGIKNVTINEPFFAGHFPGYPIMPGVLIVEALAQVGAVAMLQAEGHRGKLGFLAGADRFRFREQVKPGDTLTLEVEITRFKGSIGKGKAIAKVGDKIAAEGELMFALSDKEGGA